MKKNCACAPTTVVAGTFVLLHPHPPPFVKSLYVGLVQSLAGDAAPVFCIVMFTTRRSPGKKDAGKPAVETIAALLPGGASS
jgi:hypothetical protein